MSAEVEFVIEVEKGRRRGYVVDSGGEQRFSRRKENATRYASKKEAEEVACYLPDDCGAKIVTVPAPKKVAGGYDPSLDYWSPDDVFRKEG